jgi:hypothetical protein
MDPASSDLRANNCDSTSVFAVDSHFLLESDSAFFTLTNMTFEFVPWLNHDHVASKIHMYGYCVLRKMRLAVINS